MKKNIESVMTFEQAPAWVERSVPRRQTMLGDVPSVLLIRIPDEKSWVVASRLATDVVANPGSFLGGFLRSHCALLAMSHISNN